MAEAQIANRVSSQTDISDFLPDCCVLRHSFAVSTKDAGLISHYCGHSQFYLFLMSVRLEQG
jgi:hypothetical protein